MKKGTIAFIACVFLGFIIMFCVLLSNESNARNQVIGPFKPYLEQYISAGAEGEASLPADIKAVVLTCDNQTSLDKPARYSFAVDEFNQLPEEMRAKTAEEVNTVIRISKMYERVGYYVQEKNNAVGSDAYAIRAYVTVVNYKTGIAYVKNKVFYKNPPKKTPFGSERLDRVSADVPMEDIVRFLKAESGK